MPADQGPLMQAQYKLLDRALTRIPDSCVATHYGRLPVPEEIEQLPDVRNSVEPVLVEHERSTVVWYRVGPAA